MATVYHHFDPRDVIPASSNYPTYDVIAGSNFPVSCLDFDASTKETCYIPWVATNYGSGNLTLTVYWYADSASSGDVIWGCALSAITANSDTQDIETDSLATAQTVTDSHIGTTGQRLHLCDITISNLDSLASGDFVTMSFYRDAAAGGDTMTGDACVVALRLSYSDT